MIEKWCSQELSNARWIVAAAWPYVNASPHLGSFLHLLSGDVISRYLRLRGQKVLYVSGSDAHGTPIVIAAESLGISPQEVALKYHREYDELLRRWDIVFDNYSITHNPTHIEFCQEFYRSVQKNGYIFESASEQAYCPRCKRFLPDRFVEGTCPTCGWPEARGDQCTSPDCGHLLSPNSLVDARCVVCGASPIPKKTKHWYFDLPKVRDELESFLHTCNHLTESARNSALRLLEEGLIPRPITRDLKWGIPAGPIFEGAEGKVLYVWAENVLGYVSATKELSEKEGRPESWKDIWQDEATKTVFCIGKDNTIFHAIMFPALLIASREGYALPDGISVTEFIQFEDQPFSKSKGVGIGAEEALDVASADCWRYFLIVERPEAKDLNFTWERFVQRINNDLNNVLGNFIHRALTFVCREFDQRVPPRGPLSPPDRKALESIEIAAGKQSELLEEYKLKQSLETVISLAREGNMYLSSREPWKLVTVDRESAATILNVSIQVASALAIMISPYLPNTSREIRKMMNLPRKIGSKEFECVGKSPIKPGHRVSKPKVLFRRLNMEDINSQSTHS